MLWCYLWFDIMLINKELTMKEDWKEREKYSTAFFKNHSDTMAIIGVNIAMGAILLSICLSNISSIAAANARTDTLHIMFYDLLREGKK